MLLSRLPIVWSRLHALPMRRTLRPLNTRNAALECMIRTPAGPVRILSLHLAHIAAEERLEQIDYLLAEHRRAPSDGGPWSGADDEPVRNWSNGEAEPENPLAAIWLGDFNMEPGSAEYRRIVGSTPYHRGAAYPDGFVDSAAVAAEPTADFHTHEKIDRRRGWQNAGSTIASSAACLPGACARSAPTLARSRRTIFRCGSTSTWRRRVSPRPSEADEPGMTLFVFFAVLAAAAMHAIWNALVKVHLDRFLSITLMTLGMGAAALVVLPFVRVPKAEVWPYIIASVVFHMGYRTFLIGAYKAGDFAQTYPLARGTAPLLAALGGMFVVAEVPGAAGHRRHRFCCRPGRWCCRFAAARISSS